MHAARSGSGAPAAPIIITMRPTQLIHHPRSSSHLPSHVTGLRPINIRRHLEAKLSQHLDIAIAYINILYITSPGRPTLVHAQRAACTPGP